MVVGPGCPPCLAWAVCACLGRASLAPSWQPSGSSGAQVPALSRSGCPARRRWWILGGTAALGSAVFVVWAVLRARKDARKRAALDGARQPLLQGRQQQLQRGP